MKRTISAQLHILATFLATFGLGFLLYFSLSRPGLEQTIACLVFGLTGMMVFASSALYHFCSDGFVISPQLEKWLNNFDHFSIYLFIAGTYTPFLVNSVQGGWKYILLGLIWLVAILGILYSFFKPSLPKWAQHRFISTGIFLAMGWILVLRWNEIYESISYLEFFLLLAGGLSYSVGALVYAFERPKLFEGVFGHHEIWHIMVMLGFGFHYFLILGFYI